MQEARMWQLRGQARQRLAALAMASQYRGDNDAILVEYINGLISSGEMNQAAELAGQNLTSPQQGPVIRSLLGRAQVQLGQEEMGLSNLRQALTSAISPESLQAIGLQLRMAVGPERAVEMLESWGGNEWRVLLALSQAYNSAKMSAEARDALMQAQTLTPDGPAKAYVYQQLGITFYSLGEYERSRDSYLQAVDISPRDYQSLNNLAYVLAERLNDARTAEVYAQKAVEIMPTDGNVLDTLGWVYFKLDKLDQAAEAMRRSTEISPNYANLYHYGQVLQRQGKTDEARKQYELGLELMKDQPDEECQKLLKDSLESLQVG
jgi:tetratricopeptide (TPR) repeat protein